MKNLKIFYFTHILIEILLKLVKRVEIGQLSNEIGIGKSSTFRKLPSLKPVTDFCHYYVKAFIVMWLYLTL